MWKLTSVRDSRHGSPRAPQKSPQTFLTSRSMSRRAATALFPRSLCSNIQRLLGTSMYGDLYQIFSVVTSPRPPFATYSWVYNKNISSCQDAFDKAFHVLHEGDTTGLDNVSSAASDLSHVLLHGGGETFQLTRARRRFFFVFCILRGTWKRQVAISHNAMLPGTQCNEKKICGTDISLELVSRTLSTHWIPLATPPCFLIHASSLE
jgi:hypothetical protein